MGKRQRRRSAELPLFDLPLNPADAETETGGTEATDEPSQPEAEPSAGRSGSGSREAAQLDLLGHGRSPADTPPQAREPRAARDPRRETAEKVRVGDRLLAGMADLAAQLLMVGLAVAASLAQGIAFTTPEAWIPLGVLGLTLSFLYWVVPLAFWGRTPGMAWVGHTARAQNDQPLTFGQTFLRWVGAIGTLALAGLPLLLALTGRSLSDRLSDSTTVAYR